MGYPVILCFLLGLVLSACAERQSGLGTSFEAEMPLSGTLRFEG